MTLVQHAKFKDYGAGPYDCAIGVDIGGTTIKSAVINLGGKSIYQAHVPTPHSGSDALYKTLFAQIEQLEDHCRKSGLTPCGVGVGVPGVVKQGHIVSAIDNLPFLKGVHLASAINRPDLVLENDAYLMAFAESKAGAAKSAETAIFLTIGTGIGGAFMFGSEIYRGAHGSAGEIGNMLVKDMETRTWQRFELKASTTALIRKYLSLNPNTHSDAVNGRYIIGRFEAQEAAAMQAIDWHFDHLAIGIASLLNMLDPELVVIGGGISMTGELYVSELENRIRKIVMPELNTSVNIALAQLGSAAGSIGAGLVVMQQAASAE